MSTSRRVFTSLLIAAAIAVVIALVVRKEDQPIEEEGEEEQTEVLAAPEPEVPDEPEPEPEPRPSAVPVARTAQVEQPDTYPQGVVPQEEEDGGPPPPLEGELREHAMLMMTPLAKQAMEDRDLDSLKALLVQVRERRAENLMAANDIEGLEIAIACLEGGREARDEARDFLQFGAPTSFGDSLRTACFGASR